MLQELMQITGDLGGSLDYTATHYNKLRDRQLALGKVAKVVYGVLLDHANNEEREDDKRFAEEKLEEIKNLLKIVYPDRSGEIRKILNQDPTDK